MNAESERDWERRRFHVFGSLCLLVFLINFGRIVFAPLLDPFMRAFGVGEATVAVGITDFGRTSFTMGYELRYEGESVATAETVQVAVDEDGRPIDVPDSWRDRVAAARSDAV